MQAWICIERSSRPPKAPPTPPRVRRTFSGGRPSDSRHLVVVDVQPLGRDVEVDAALAVGHREPRLGPEEGLVLHADLVLAADHDVGRRVGVAVVDAQMAQDVAGAVQPRRVRRVGMQLRRAGRHRASASVSGSSSW